MNHFVVRNCRIDVTDDGQGEVKKMTSVADLLITIVAPSLFGSTVRPRRRLRRFKAKQESASKACL